MAIQAGDPVLASDWQPDRKADVGTNDTSASTSYVTGTSHGIDFVAPTSGAVEITHGGLLGNNHTVVTQTSVTTIQIRTGGTVGSGTIILAAADTNGARYYKPNTAGTYHYNEVSRKVTVTGLTPGNTYNVQTLFRAVAGSAGVANRQVYVRSANV